MRSRSVRDCASVVRGITLPHCAGLGIRGVRDYAPASRGITLPRRTRTRVIAARDSLAQVAGKRVSPAPGRAFLACFLDKVAPFKFRKDCPDDFLGAGLAHVNHEIGGGAEVVVVYAI